jgi:2-octaprenyl-6-methoxyphenol hydroxylase
MDADFDIVINGAGLVATSLIAALSHSRLRIAVLETHLPEQINYSSENPPLSLTYSSQKILDTMGVWSDLAASATPITTVHISEQQSWGILRFRATEENVPALGYVTSLTQVQQLLYQRAAQNPQVKFIRIQQLNKIDHYSQGKRAITVQTLDGEKTFITQLLVAADGTRSPTRALLEIHTVEKSHDDVALPLTVEFTQGHQNTAYERFTKHGVIAILPLPHPQRCQVVWTLSAEFAAHVSTWPDQQLTEHCQAAMHGRLGEWRLLSRGRTIPLSTVIAEEQTRPGAVLLGNAAHTIYPLAAQGFNLGLRDAAALAEILINAAANHLSLGNAQVLQSYLDWRTSDQHQISSLTSGVSQLFALQIPGLSCLRATGMLAADLFPPLKHRLARRLMGLAGKSSNLARGISL